jgi:hypothetical protein
MLKTDSNTFLSRSVTHFNSDSNSVTVFPVTGGETKVRNKIKIGRVGLYL